MPDTSLNSGLNSNPSFGLGLSQARLVEPVLSNFARGYTNASMVADSLFPHVTIGPRGAKVLRFGKDCWRLMNASRAPGAQKKRVQYGFDAGSVSLVQEALEGLVPVEMMEEAARVPGVDLGMGAAQMVMDILLLNKEVESARLATDPKNYASGNTVALGGTDQWSSGNSHPEQDVLEWKETIRRQIGRYPNTMLLSPDVFGALKIHPLIKQQFIHTSAQSVTTDMLAALFDMEKVVVGKAVYLPEQAGDTDLASDVWSNCVVLAWVPTGHSLYRVPSYGYTYMLSGMPAVETPYWQNENDSWVYPVKYERRAYLTGADAGFLATNVVGD